MNQEDENTERSVAAEQQAAAVKGKSLPVTEIIRPPKHASAIPINVARKVRKEFKEWKRQFIDMISRKSTIEWFRQAGGQVGYRFILSADLCEVVYEVQIRERIRAQTEAAMKKAREDGGEMPDKETIEKIALANLQQEFMSFTVATMKQLFIDQQVASSPALQKRREATETTDGPNPEEEAASAANLAEMRRELVKDDFGGKVVSAEEGIRAELDKRE